MNDLNSIIITGQVNTITKPDNCVLWIDIHRNKKERDVSFIRFCGCLCISWVIIFLRAVRA